MTHHNSEVRGDPHSHKAEEEEEEEREEERNIHLGLALVETFYHLAQFILLACLLRFSGNWLWVALYLLIIFIDLVDSIFFLRKSRTEFREISILEIIPFFQGCFACNSRKRDHPWRWFVVQNFCWFWLIMLWIRPAFLYMDAFGGTFLWASSLSGRSSCSDVIFTEVSTNEISSSECQARAVAADVVYNPSGAFKYPDSLTSQIGEEIVHGIFANCFMEQTWSAPVFKNLTLGGYAVNSRGRTICSSPLVGGSLSRDNCPRGNIVCPDAFPGSWYGYKLSGLLSPIQISNTSANIIDLCPGNNANPYTLPGGEIVVGAPLPVCAYCLFYQIWLGARAVPPIQPVPELVLNTCLPTWQGDPNVSPKEWKGWSAFADGTTTETNWCVLCPGRNGLGGPGFNQELFQNQNISDAYWLYTSSSFIAPAARKFGIALVLIITGMLRCCPPDEKKKRKRKRHF